MNYFDGDNEELERIVDAKYMSEDGDSERSLRPTTLDEYVGQSKAKENLKISIDAAKQRIVTDVFSTFPIKTLKKECKKTHKHTKQNESDKLH